MNQQFPPVVHLRITSPYGRLDVTSADDSEGAEYLLIARNLRIEPEQVHPGEIGGFVDIVQRPWWPGRLLPKTGVAYIVAIDDPRHENADEYPTDIAEFIGIGGRDVCWRFIGSLEPIPWPVAYYTPFEPLAKRKEPA